jgi:Protein of unknown function (DUF3617)
MTRSFALAVLAATAVRGVDPTPLDLKTGEWEYTVNMQMSGMPQRTSTNKNCVRKEDLAKLNPLANDDKSCKMTVVNSSGSKLEAKMECESPGNKSTSTVTIEASGQESSKFSVVSTGVAEGHPMNMTVNGTGKWLGATCTEAK